ncbi:MAG: hypothetical protein H0W54_06460 [Rubrobacter sp.]|nr:hypothetical protein [Rubrobacter sp.]
MFGYLALVLGIIDVPFASAFFTAAVGLGALLSVAGSFSKSYACAATHALSTW